MSAKQSAIWMSASKPFDKSAYKEVNFGRGFTTICAYSIMERMDQDFGPCGMGWGWANLKWEIHGKSVVCIGEIWYIPKDKDCDVLFKAFISAVGDAVVVKENVAEAFKKSQTNLLSKASSFIGMGIGVYQGKGIDDPYLDREAEQKAPRKAQKAPAKASKAETPDLTWAGLKSTCKGHDISLDTQGGFYQKAKAELGIGGDVVSETDDLSIMVEFNRIMGEHLKGKK